MKRSNFFTLLLVAACLIGGFLHPSKAQAQTFQCLPTVRVDKTLCQDPQPGMGGWFCPGIDPAYTEVGFVATCTDQTNCSTGDIFVNGICSSNDTCIIGNKTERMTTINDCSRCMDPTPCEDSIVSGASSYTCITGKKCGCSSSAAFCGMSGTVPTPPAGSSVGCNAACPVGGCPAPLSCVVGAGPNGDYGCWAAGSCGGGSVGSCPANFVANFDTSGNLVTTFTRGGWKDYEETVIF